MDLPGFDSSGVRRVRRVRVLLVRMVPRVRFPLSAPARWNLEPAPVEPSNPSNPRTPNRPVHRVKTRIITRRGMDDGFRYETMVGDGQRCAGGRSRGGERAGVGPSSAGDVGGARG